MLSTSFSDFLKLRSCISIVFKLLCVLVENKFNLISTFDFISDLYSEEHDQ